MPENLLQFLQSQMAPAQAVSTGVAHSNIDNLMDKPSDYGKPFEYVSTNVGTPKALAIPLNMSRYAELIAKSGVGEAIHPFIKSEVPLSYNFLNEPASTPDTLSTGRAWKSDEKRTLLDIASRGKYKSSKDIPELTEINREKIHTALLAAGMTPGLGNIADAADALLYAAEGEFGSAGLSAAAMIPMVGQLVSAKRALKAAKKSGEEMVTLYRGVEKWHKGTMVKRGKFIGGGGYVDPKYKEALWITEHKSMADKIASVEGGLVLEFEVPKSYMEKNFTSLTRIAKKKTGIFHEGLPKEFLKKVHR